LDTSLQSEVDQFISRLVAERNLRKRKGLYTDTISNSKKEHVDELNDLITDAEKKAVETQYVEEAKYLTGQMDGNIKSRHILNMFQDYPEREYPEEDIMDPKKKKDPKAKPKKKKKEKELPYPEWGVELQNVRDTVD